MFHGAKRYQTMLREEFRGYNAGLLAKDVLAGVTVAAVSLPLALAFGVASGASAAAGLLTAIVAGFVSAVFAGGFYQISGPTGTMTVVLLAVSAQYGVQGIFLATFMAGILRIVAGALHLGRLTSFIPAPVITGFTSGIALMIAAGQIDNFFGVTSEGSGTLERIFSYARLGFHPQWQAVLVSGLVVVFMIVFPKKWSAVVPSSLLGIILATAICAIGKLDVAVVGAMPQTLLPAERFSFAGVTLTEIKDLLGPSLSVAVLCMIETLLCGASAGRMVNRPLDCDGELFAQGLGNLIVPFFGGVPSTAALARTSVAIKSGSVTRLTGVFQSVTLLLGMLLCAPLLSRIPLAGLAGVLMVTAWRMNDWATIRYFFSHKLKSSIGKFAITMVLTVVFDLTTAILIGVALAMVTFVLKSSGVEISVEQVDPKRMGRDSLPGSEDISVVYITGPLFFMTAETLQKSLMPLVGTGTILLSMRGVPTIDVTAIGALRDFITAAQQNGTEVLLCGVQPAVYTMLERTDIVAQAGEASFYQSADKALTQLLLSEAANA